LDAFVTCEDVEKSKPNPDIFLKAAELLGTDAKDCMVIEDALNGIQAAKSA
jgi:HAD superfamily hydrolase (TIGR01509 family)